MRPTVDNTDRIQKKQRDVILLIRHGEAQDSHPLGDEARALTTDGRNEMRAHAEAVTSRVALKGIVTSPLVRAVQTAEILAWGMGVEKIEVRSELDFKRATPKRIESLIHDYGAGWAFVGHNPSMGTTLAHLIGHDDHAVRFKKGAVAALAFTGGKTQLPWRLEWIWGPGENPRTQISGM